MDTCGTEVDWTGSGGSGVPSPGGKRDFFCPKPPERLWGPSSFVLREYWDSFHICSPIYLHGVHRNNIKFSFYRDT